MDYIIRNFDFDDIPALAATAAAIEQADRRGWVVTPEKLGALYSRPGLDPEQNVFVAELPGGQLAGNVTVLLRLGEGQAYYELAGGVHPAWRRQGIGTALLQAGMNRARERRGESADVQVWLVVEDVREQDVGWAALVEKHGFDMVRWHVDMSRDLPGPGRIAPLVPPMQTPPGLRLRKWRAGIDDPAVGEMLNVAFRDHWGAADFPVNEFVHIVQSGFFTLEHCVLAWDPQTDHLAGACVNRVDPGSWAARGRRELFIAVLGVRRDYRKRGLGRALLTWSLQRADHLEMEGVSLDADAENTTGAIRLYTALGFYVTGKKRLYRRPLD